MGTRTETVDRTRIRRMIAELQVEMERVDMDTARRLRQAIYYLRLAATAPPWPPEPILRELLNTGRDNWVADLLRVTRNAVRAKRKLLRIDPFDRGGSNPETREDRERWMEEWGARLTGAGLHQDHQAG